MSSSTRDVIRVVVVDDQPVVRTGFRTILSAQGDITVVGEAGDGRSAIDEITRHRPDVALVDVRMPGVDGIEVTKHVSTITRVLVLTTFDLDEYVYEALRAGASGFLLKDVSRDDLVHAVRVVAAGDAVLAPSVTRRLIQDFASRRPRTPARTESPALTERERDVLRLMARGLSNAEIARELFVSEATVKTHISHVLMKLGVRDRVQAVIYAYEHGLTEP